MSAQEFENRKGCNRRVILFFVFAILVVAAFFIVGLVRTCSTEHEEKEAEKRTEQLEQQIEEQQTAIIPSQDSQQVVE